MNRLIVCNTYYQLILSVQLKNTIMKNDYLCVFVSDHSKNAKKIVDEIVRYGIFDECYYIETKKLHQTEKSVLKKVNDCFRIGLGISSEYARDVDRIRNKEIDEIISFNYGIEIDAYHAYLTQNKKQIGVSFMEEGILSYENKPQITKKRTFIKYLRHLKKQKMTAECFENFYCYYPEIYDGVLNPVRVPKIESGSKTSNELIKIFGIENNLQSYKEKYIFFTSVYDFEGEEPIGEFDLVCKIANMIGKENLLVKTHPRDRRMIYLEKGFNVDKNSSIPWEVIQLSRDFSDKVFITINSGSVLAGSTMSHKPITTFYMYRLCELNKNKTCRFYTNVLARLLENVEMKTMFKTVHIAERLEDIL